jgi:hypothetical protein
MSKRSKHGSYYLWERRFSPYLLILEGRAIAWACLFLAIGANPGTVATLFYRDALKHSAGTKRLVFSEERKFTAFVFYDRSSRKGGR